MDEMTAQEKTWINALKRFWPKAKVKGWKRSMANNYAYHDGDTLTIEVLDPTGNKHLLKVSRDGEVYF